MTLAKCALKRARKRRAQVNLTIDPDLLNRIRKLMYEMGENSLSNFTEGLYDCVLRDDCEGCPAYENLTDDEKSKIKGKVGVGKWIDEDE
jgi:hypothetical protein